MMQLTPEKKATLTQWLVEQKSLSDIQKSIKEEWNESITYMDLRFLIDDLDLAIREKERPNVQQEFKKEVAQDLMEEMDAPSGVRVTLDAVTRPGTVASGTVTFSDGQSANWMLDAMGRLGLDPRMPGYSPNQEDIHAFQLELQKMLR